MSSTSSQHQFSQINECQNINNNNSHYFIDITGIVNQHRSHQGIGRISGWFVVYSGDSDRECHRSTMYGQQWNRRGGHIITSTMVRAISGSTSMNSLRNFKGQQYLYQCIEVITNNNNVDNLSIILSTMNLYRYQLTMGCLFQYQQISSVKNFQCSNTV